MIVPYYILEELGISEHLASDFFIAFARFEYALKASGYVNKGGPYAKPDWDLWAKDPKRRSAFDSLIQNPQTDKEQTAYLAFSYISNAPPKKQKWDDATHRLDWDDTCLLQGSSHLEKMVDALRRIRNNLFHGGKFLTPDSSSETRRARNERLVVHALALLEIMLTLDRDLSLAFYH